MSFCSVKLVTMNRPAFHMIQLSKDLPLFGLIMALSNMCAAVAVPRACDSAQFFAVLTKQKAIGTTTVAKAAALSNSFLLKSSFRATLFAMIRTTLFLRSAPVTPDTQVTGDSTQDRKSTRLNSSHVSISYAVFC